MPVVQAMVDQLLDDGLVQLSWKGRPLDSRSGPYRIALKTVDDDQSLPGGWAD